ncbi:SGNH/GDSL hydrolase family protein [Jiangella aurantiaca]|uniref:SGNH/GDSL hydrolase family protein n=1 Tax=Jiangella aurantiaca TaxID=2530373 RepID=A0A4V6PEG6_9ACTN|nr:SGNH/GDSL hydrolase family protein [Jiangella aurantiaca]TDD68607.1 SGNH/GDSL hydrolase family protein [Jiangella aurantiaca]
MNRLLFPIVALQGLWVRSTFTLAGPVDGPLTGTTGEGAGPPLRVAILGESTAAGSGVDSHDDGFAGGLAAALAARTGRPVDWEVAAQFGATARRIRYRLLPRLTGDYDVAVLLAGANDVLTRRPAADWGADLAVIVDGLGERAERVVVAGIPPFGLFPGLPRTLRRYLGERAAALDAVAREVCAARPRVTWTTVGTDVPPSLDFFSADRFHPSATGYGLWSSAVADAISPA